jgi:WD40 repeat protein
VFFGGALKRAVVPSSLLPGSSLQFVKLAWVALLLLVGCGTRVVVSAGPEDASAPDAPHVVDAAVTDTRDAAVDDVAVEDAALPPFSIPDAPRAGSLRPCGTTVEPMPVGFSQDGRVLMAQSLGSSRTRVRAWDPATNALEDIFTAEGVEFTSRLSITTSQSGDRIVVNDGSSFHIFDCSRRRFVTDAPVPIAIHGVSGDGHFVIDRDLVRRNALGAEPFDFGALLPTGLHSLPDPGLIALSPIGDAVALALFDREAVVVVLAVVYQDGRVIVLPRGPDSDLKQTTCAGECGFRWSRDGRRLVMYSSFLLSRVWDVEKNSLLLAEEPGVRSANFSPTGTSLITVAVADGAIVERDLAGGPTFKWGTARANGSRFFPTFDAAGDRLLFSGSRPGDPGSGLALATRDAGGAYWRGAVRSWNESALALAGNTLFALLRAWDPPVEFFHVMLGSYAIEGGPLKHVLDPETDERQSEWNGQIVVSPDEQRVAAILPDTVRVVDAATLAPLTTIAYSAGMVAWSPDGRYLVSTPDLHYRDSARPPLMPRAEVTLWDALSGRATAKFPVPAIPVMVAFDEQGKKLVGWGRSSVDKRDDRISFEVDLATGRAFFSPMQPFVAATRELVATSTSIFRISTGEVVSSLDVPPIASGVFSGDGSMLLAMSGTASSPMLPLRLFGVKDGHLIATLTDFWFNPLWMTFALSRDGRRVAVGTYDSAVVYCLDDPP